MFRITVGRALSSDRRVANIGKTAALIVIRALPYTEPTAPPEALPIGLGTHMAAGELSLTISNAALRRRSARRGSDQSQASSAGAAGLATRGGTPPFRLSCLLAKRKSNRASARVTNHLNDAAGRALHGQVCLAGRPCTASSGRGVVADRSQRATAIPEPNAASNAVHALVPQR